MEDGWSQGRLQGGSAAGLPASMRQVPAGGIPPRGATAANVPEAGMNCAISTFLAIFSFFTVFMLYLYILKLGQDGLVPFWALCAGLSLSVDCFLVQPVKIFLNSRKAIKFARAQANARITARAAAGTPPCCAMLQQKHFWLLPCYIEPANNPFTLGRRLVAQLFVLAYFAAGSAGILRLFLSGETLDLHRTASDQPEQRPGIDENSVVWITAVLTAMLMFPVSKLALDFSQGAKEDTAGVFDFAHGQVVRRSKSAKRALPFMIVAIICAAFVVGRECTGADGLVAEEKGGSWGKALWIALVVDAVVLQCLRVLASLMKGPTSERSAVAVEFDWI